MSAVAFSQDEIMDNRSMIFEMHLVFQNNPSTRIIIKTGYVFIRLELLKTAPIGVSLERVFIRVYLFFVLPEKIARQTEEILKGYAL